MDNNARVRSASPQETSKAVTRGRDARGRFAAGNPGGLGNPFAKHTAMIRRAFRQALGEEEIQTLVRRLYELACAGNLGAAHFIAAYYGVGRVDPAATAPPVPGRPSTNGDRADADGVNGR